MAESRQKSPAGGAAVRRAVLPPALLGFLLLLTLMFALSYAVGSAAGPVSPGMSGTSPGGTSPDGGGDVQDMDMGGMG
ncbi:hypothetical protein BU52_32315 [Streptomyces toyocaensis]|uniref:Secreted protein n=1 Tax=Streptomyces toyocaensis TaxID=55952 RepID=A0A081XHW6_STRTO|nr:hypothetical protein [Streptomyces toyocaensis]KES03139.1 hypothetical protein BU52_32315 [Streptomyces toyocaensis]